MQSVQHRQFDWRDLLVIPQNAGLLTKTAYWRLIKKQLYVPAYIDFKIMVCAEQLPHWDNEISLAGVKDRLGIPKATFNWRPMESEERTCRVATARLAEYWRMTKLDRVCPLIWSATSPDAGLPITSKAEACAHPSGTTRIGTDPKTSIVGTDLRCHAVPNLSVVSASIFPTAGSANPTFTVMKLAYRFADVYLSRF
jgi:choline dehydrogenase-like flavoprotein